MQSSDIRPSRRSLLQSAGAIGGTLLASGLATAADGSALYVVTVKGNGVENRLKSEGFEIVRRIADGQVLGIKGAADAEDSLQQVRGVSAVTRDVALELDTPVGPEAKEQDDSEPAFGDLQWDNDVIEADAAKETATGAGTSVAIVDTGIDFDHPDLGNVRDDLGKAFVLEDDVPEFGAEDPVGHGTAVAGVVGATGEVGVEGVAPETDLVPVRVFPKVGGAFFSDIFKGIDYASEIGADAANFSLGIPGSLPPQANRDGLRAAIQTVYESAVRQGTVVSVSLGNAGANLQQGGYFTLPTSVPGTFSVSATGPNDKLVFYSNYGTNEVDVAAPGGGYETPEKTLATQGVEFPFPTNLILTTFPTDAGYEGQYGYIAGTSFSAPQVAGLAALVREVASELNPKQIEKEIAAGAELADGQSDPELGAGRINAKKTVDQVEEK